MNKPCLFLAVVVSSVSTVLAEPVVRKSNFDPEAGPNQYQVNFPPELGGGTIFMPIVGGSFELETDAAAGTSRLLSWNQDVSAIDIFGKSTGPIVITMDTGAASEGTYDPIAEHFSVSATFLITFDDTELREFGFFSPVALVGTEDGNIYGVGSIGTIRMFLEGEGAVAGSTFAYTCQTSARFEYLLDASQAQPGDVNHDRAIDISDPVAILGGLFQGSAIACPNAVNVNGDETADLSDAVYLLSYLYQGGPSIPASPVSCSSAP